MSLFVFSLLEMCGTVGRLKSKVNTRNVTKIAHLVNWGQYIIPCLLFKSSGTLTNLKLALCFCEGCLRTDKSSIFAWRRSLWNSDSSFQMISRTFLNDMKAFGLENDVCSEFLQKMSTIGELSEGKRDLEGLGWVVWNWGGPCERNFERLCSGATTARIPVYLRLLVLCFGFYRTSCAFGEQLGSG